MLDSKDIIESKTYARNPTSFFKDVSDLARPLLEDMAKDFYKIEDILYKSPSLINIINQDNSKIRLEAVLSKDQMRKLANGSLKLLSKKDGSLMAALIDPESKKIVANLPLKMIKENPELNQAMVGFAMQMQLAQIIEEVNSLNLGIENIIKSQEDDRLALANTCKQKFLQASCLKNIDVKTSLLLQVISDAEESRNLLMLSNKASLKYIIDQPEGNIKKLFKGDTQEKIDSKINNLKVSLNAINMVSLVEALAYKELGEDEAAKESLLYFSNFIDKEYLENSKITERLQLIDTGNYKFWEEKLTTIKNNIEILPIYKPMKEIEGKNYEK
ncbi:hypothetical protein [Anaerococcus vaginimassiliensis]|uniref:hypothetical protein n=1 Tax=Anaerococcus vaginimassiliensis TaxID=2042308 RepID=UPI00102FDFA4|nr:hypothetical protein [Anaerococcus vaginimassiliensis]